MKAMFLDHWENEQRVQEGLLLCLQAMTRDKGMTPAPTGDSLSGSRDPGVPPPHQWGKRKALPP